MFPLPLLDNQSHCSLDRPNAVTDFKIIPYMEENREISFLQPESGWTKLMQMVVCFRTNPFKKELETCSQLAN